MTRQTRSGQPVVYNTTPPTFSDGDEGAFQVDASGNLKVALATGDIEIGAVEVKNGTDDTRLTIAVDDSAMPATPSIIPIGAEYRSSPTTYTDGDATVAQSDVQGNIKINQSTTLDRVNDTVTAAPYKASYAYQAAAAANVVVSATPAILVGIIIGVNVSTATIEVSDHASDGDGNVKVFLSGDTLMTTTGSYLPVGAYFATGITADLTNQTQVTFIYIPD